MTCVTLHPIRPSEEGADTTAEAIWLHPQTHPECRCWRLWSYCVIDCNLSPSYVYLWVLVLTCANPSGSITYLSIYPDLHTGAHAGRLCAAAPWALHIAGMLMWWHSGRADRPDLQRDPLLYRPGELAAEYTLLFSRDGPVCGGGSTGDLVREPPHCHGGETGASKGGIMEKWQVEWGKSNFLSHHKYLSLYLSFPLFIFPRTSSHSSLICPLAAACLEFTSWFSIHPPPPRPLHLPPLFHQLLIN